MPFSTTKPVYGLSRKPGSMAQLSKFTRGWNDDRTLFLLPLAFQDVFYKRYDFENDTITGDFTVSEKAAGSTVFAISTSVENGALVGATEATDNTMIGLNYDGVFFDAQSSPGMRVRLKVNTATSIYIEAGFCDAPTQAYDANWTVTTGTADPSLVSNGTTDVASAVLDTDATQKSFVLCAVGTTDSTPKLAVLSQHGYGRNDAEAYAETSEDVPGVSPLANDTYFTVQVQINSAASATAGANNATATINGNPLLTNSVSVGLDTAKKLRPYIVVGNRAASARTFTVDYIDIWCNRQ